MRSKSRSFPQRLLPPVTFSSHDGHIFISRSLLRLLLIFSIMLIAFCLFLKFYALPILNTHISASATAGDVDAAAEAIFSSNHPRCPMCNSYMRPYVFFVFFIVSHVFLCLIYLWAAAMIWFSKIWWKVVDSMISLIGMCWCLWTWSISGASGQNQTFTNGNKRFAYIHTYTAKLLWPPHAHARSHAHTNLHARTHTHK